MNTGMMRVAAYAVIALGVGLMVLGIFEIGGLFNIAVGIVATCLGSLLAFAEEETIDREEEGFTRSVRDP
jgi:hypothetical protein